MGHSAFIRCKRFCLLNICFRPEGEQPRIAVIFCGQGTRSSDAGKEAWDHDVDAYFQPNAWPDTNFCVDWVTLQPTIEQGDHFVLLCDNFGG